MPIRKARTIDALYQAVCNHDIAITAFPRLSLALDGRVDRPRVGRVAATAHSQASGEMVPIDRRQLFLTLVKDPDLNFEQAERALEYCLHCWDWTGDPERLLTYPEFDTPAMREAIETLKSTDSSYRRLTDAKLSDTTDVAVLGETTLSTLDRTLLPDNPEYIDLFADESQSVPHVHVFSNVRDIVDAVVNSLSSTTARNTAVVLDRSSVYAPLLEAALDVAEIPYQHTGSFVDDDELRACLRLFRATFTGSDLRVRDIQPSLEQFGFEVDRNDRNRRVEHADGEMYDALREFFDRARRGALHEALTAFEEFSGWSSPPLTSEVDELGIGTADFTSSLVSQLRFYLESFDVPTHRKDDTEGLLIADCTSTTYVDRHTVFYLGLDEGWARTPPDVPWIDDTAFARRDLERFQLLLQNGDDRHYLALQSRGGDPVRPCVYFGELIDEEIESFVDLPHTRYRQGVRSDETARPFHAPDSGSSSISTVSQSTLSRLTNCPRDEYFHRLVASEDSFPAARGRAIHEAAEIRADDPATFEERREEIVDEICDRLEPFVALERLPVQRANVELGLEALDIYLDANSPRPHEPRAYGHRDHENALADSLGIEIESPLTERWFDSPEIGLRGYVDLVREETDIVDYKTGSKSSASQLREKAAIDPPDDTPNFQAAAYLAQHRRAAPGETVSIHFVHLLEESEKILAGQSIDPDELVTTLTYLPCTFGEFAARRDVYDAVTDYAETNPRVKALGPLGYERYREFFETHDLPREGTDPGRREKVVQSFVDYTKEHFKDTKYVKRGCRKAVEDIDGLSDEYYLKSDLDAFEKFVSERIADLERYHENGFPVRLDDDGPNWDGVDHPELVITDE